MLPDFGTAAGTPRVRLRTGSGRLQLKLEQLLPSGSVYDRIAAPLLEAALGAVEPGPFLVAGCGSACLSFAAAARRLRVPLELVVPEASLPEHRRLLAQHRLPEHTSPGASLLAAAEHARGLEARGRGRVLYAPGAPGRAGPIWARTLGAELRGELAAEPQPRPTVFLPSGLSDLAEALASDFSCRLVGSAGGQLQDGSFPADERSAAASLTDEEAYASRRRLAREEGLLLGYASAAAVEVARRAVESGAVSAAWVVVLDAGDRYFSYDGRFPADPQIPYRREP